MFWKGVGIGGFYVLVSFFECVFNVRYCLKGGLCGFDYLILDLVFFWIILLLLLLLFFSIICIIMEWSCVSFFVFDMDYVYVFIGLNLYNY